MSYTRRSYTSQTPKSTSPSQAIEDSKKKSTLLKDSSWIKKDSDEDEPVDRDPNFGKSILGRYRSNETLERTETVDTPRPKISSTSSVQALSKRFSASQDELDKGSTLPPSYGRTSTSYTRRSTSTKTDAEAPKASTTTTTTTTKDGKTTETTTTTTSRSSVKKPTAFTDRVFADVKKGTSQPSFSPSTKTTKVTETTITDNKATEDKLYDTLMPRSVKDNPESVSKTETVTVKSGIKGDGTSTTTTTTTTITSSKPVDDLYDTLLPKSTKSDISSPVSTTSIIKREVTRVDSKGDDPKTTTTTTTRTSSSAEDDLFDSLMPKSLKSSLSSPVRDEPKTITTTTRTSSSAEDDLYDSLLPKSMKSDLSSPVQYKRESVTLDRTKSDDSPTSTRTSITSYSSYTNGDTPSTRTTSYTISSEPKTTSPTVYSPTSYKDSRLDDLLSKSSIKTNYSSPERKVLEKDLCSYCRKPFNSEAKMVLDEMKINCHASCFKCEVCNCTLGHLKAGDSMWVYRRTVHCENCFDNTREKWRR